MDYSTFRMLIAYLHSSEDKEQFSNLVSKSISNMGLKISEEFYIELQNYSSYKLSYYIDGHIDLEEIKIIEIYPSDNYKIVLKLNNNKIKILDMNQFLCKGDFTKLKDVNTFKTAKLDCLEGIEWDCYNLSLSRDTILKHSRYL
ncbi:DUF2442 domain-containing protein [Paraclostridium sordellii]|uniref:DUF2442 domain-containing protein n=1 Tax=Paraclostridium sordellii TaxID=1505 RepID=UPI0005E2BFB8|nr:DUF2442 domain-containing protein [Paeniclostridium sordellii]CEP45202.1 Protein of uncharacterised function (DUF2442) [[Clostridium] sordellii] [Paeniclostridium sordellii]